MNWVVDTGAQLSFVPKSGFDKYGKKLEKLGPLCNSNRKLVGAGYNTPNCVSHVTVELGVENTGITEPVYIVDAATKLLLGLPLKIWINSQCAENLQYHRKGTSESWRCSSVYRLGQKFLDKYFGWRNFGEMFVFCAQNSSGTTSQLPINHSQNIFVIVICVPRQCFLIVVQLTITKNQVCAVESTMSRSGNNVVLSATWVGIAGIEWEWRIAMLLFKWWWWQENWIFISQ